MSGCRWLLVLVAAPSLVGALSYDWVDDPQYLVVKSAIPNCVDARANGMGKVSMAGMQSSQAIFSNPAAIAVMDKTSIALGGRLLAGFINDGYQKFVNASYSAYLTPHLKFTNIAAATALSFPETPFTIGLGVGYHTPYDLGHNVYAEADTSGVTKTTYKYSGGLNAIAPSLSFGLFKKYALGITVHKSLPLLETLSYEAVDKKEGNPDAEYSYEATGSAFYITIGATAKLGIPLELGLSFSTGPTWRFAAEKTRRSLGIGGENKIDIDGPLPWLAGLAGQYRFTEKLTAALEVQTRMLNILDRAEYADAYSPGIAARLGGEYALGQSPLRFGVFMESAPYAGIDSIADPSSPGMLIGASAGLSLPVKAAKIDCALQWSRFGVGQDDGIEKFTYSENAFRIDAGLTFNLPSISLAPKHAVVPDSLTPEPMEEPGQRRPYY